MKHERVIEQALRDVQDVLCANLALTHNLADDRAAACLRTIVGAPHVQIAIERGNDTALNFVLRGANRILRDPLLPPTTIIILLWGMMDEPALEHRLGQKENARVMFGRKKPPAR